MYCGIRTKKGKMLWAAYCAILLPTIIAWIVAFATGSKCQDDREEQGCFDSEVRVEFGSVADECESSACTTSGVFALIAIVLSILSAVPCCCCCCCSQPPTKQTVTAGSVPAGPAYGVPVQAAAQGPPQYDHTGQNTGTGQYTTPHTGSGQYSEQYTGTGAAQPYNGTGQYGAGSAQPYKATGDYHASAGTAQPAPQNY